eukprot:scaffold8236_cov123-Isochrysis_galbana.AAC.9
MGGSGDETEARPMEKRRGGAGPGLEQEATGEDAARAPQRKVRRLGWRARRMLWGERPVIEERGQDAPGPGVA